MTDVELLYQVADEITTGHELMGSRWGQCEAEQIACQAITSCRFNHKMHGDTFSWYGNGLLHAPAMGNNQSGLACLISDGCIVAEPYEGDLEAPPDTVHGICENPMVLRVTRRLLEYAAELCRIETGSTDPVK